MLLNDAPASVTSPRSGTALRRLALVGWVVIAVANLIYYAFDLASDYTDMLVPCPGTLGSGGECNFLAISATEMATLSTWGLPPHTYAAAMTVSPLILLAVYWALGGLILARQHTTWLGLTVSLALIILPVTTVSGDNDWSGSAPLFFVLAMLVGTTGAVGIAFLYLIPNGRFAPHWAYLPMTLTIVLVALLNLEINGVVPFSAQVTYLLRATTFGLVLFGCGLQIYRYWRASDSVERQQTRLILIGVIAYVVSVVLWVLIFGSTVAIPPGAPRLLVNVGGWTFINTFTLLILPAAIAIAILRHNLWNMDAVLNRALVYGGLTLGIILLYVITVAGLGLLFQTSGNLIISLVATGIVAVAFNPVRARLQRSVDRLMYGQRDDPYAVLSALNQQLQSTVAPTETLAAVVETVATTLKLPFVAIELLEQGEQVGRAATGAPMGDVTDYPLRYQTETVGRLTVAPRSSGEQFTAHEQQLLADIAGQIGPAASATRLTLALQRSRETLVVAREEERRRIRRDLHDGFGPTLASQTLALDAVLDTLAAGDTVAAAGQITALKGQTQQMVADIRRLVYELRPPALDELGLVEALRAHVAQMGADGQLRIVIEARPDPLPPLSAAIEVAAYRIALEGVTNVIRHARATACHVHFVIDRGARPVALVVSITDDGAGLPPGFAAGVGVTSMRERADELGGRCEITARPHGGTGVTATLPLALGGE